MDDPEVEDDFILSKDGRLPSERSGSIIEDVGVEGVTKRGTICLLAAVSVDEGYSRLWDPASISW